MNTTTPPPPVGNAAAMREALETVRKYVKETTPDKVMLGVIEVWCDEALAKPPRNCDVGTAEEQVERYRAAGEVYHTLTLTNALEWGQMPYESEANNAKQ